MAKPGDVLDVPELGGTIEFHRTGEETGGALCEFELRGRPRGFLVQEHVHARQAERFEPVSGSMTLVMHGREETFGPGEVREVPPGTPHRQLAGGDGSLIVRVTMRPAGRIEGFLERLAQLSQDGRLTRSGFPRPTAAAELVRDFGDEGRATRPPAAVQDALATAILGSARAGRALRERAAGASGEYLFVDEWDVAAPPEAVFDALADARTYPRWWTPVYIDAEADGPPAIGRESRQHFKGRLPYHLRTTSTVTRLEPPRVLEGEVEGDLRGRGLWTLTPAPQGTHVRFDWRVHADRPLLRTLTPVLRPLFRWNHDYAISRAKAGLEPYARATAAAEAAAAEPATDAGDGPPPSAV
jgi:uncharacterized protein YndB with AHSA1/START domain/mannose-6-phosphate isomerase-like protein (cupin superfamily)